MQLRGFTRALNLSRALLQAGAPCWVVIIGGCALNSTQNALDPAGPQAAQMESLWWLSFALAAVVYLVVMVAVAYAIGHRKRRSAHVLAIDAHQEKRSTRWVAIATGITILVLFVFLVVDLLASRSLGAMQREPAMRIRITGYQWWWRIEYSDTNATRTLQTANELHIPVGRMVELQLETGDVIHSFWVPALGGKRDMVPGQKNRLWLKADRAGTYRSECAEYCGLQHAKMALTVIAHDSSEFSAWYSKQLSPAAMPADSVRQKGLNTFLGSSCVLCHQIRGTTAAGQVGPDLTHVGSRSSLAAGTIPNTRGHLGGWIADPQGVKPGARMPPTKLGPAELHALIAYIEGLK